MTLDPQATSRPADRAARNLRRTLVLNATSSAGCGVLMALAAGPLGRLLVPDGGTLLGLDAAGWIMLVGLALLPFAALVLLAAAPAQPRPGLIAAIIALDIAWVAGSALLLLLAGAALSWPAWIAILAVADMVALFAFLQHRFRRQSAGGTVAADGGPRAAA